MAREPPADVLGNLVRPVRGQHRRVVPHVQARRARVEIHPDDAVVRLHDVQQILGALARLTVVSGPAV